MTSKPFCYWHIKTKENPKGTDCAAHLAYGRVFKCNYTSPSDPEIHHCVDYEPLKRRK